MTKNFYYNGELIPAKDWDYKLNKPKVKEPKAKKEKVTEIEVDLSFIEQLED